MNPQQPQQPIKQFQPGVAPVVPDGQGQIYAKGTGGPVVNDQSVPAMTPVKPSATTPQPLNVPQVGVFPPDPRKMASFNNKYLRIAKEWRKKTAEKAGIMEKKAILPGLSTGLGLAAGHGLNNLYDDGKDLYNWATDKVDGWRGGFGSGYAGATSQRQGGGSGGANQPPPTTPGPPTEDRVDAKPQPQSTAGPYGSTVQTPTIQAAPAAPAPFRTQWYVPGGSAGSRAHGFGGSVPYVGNNTWADSSTGEPKLSGRIKVTSQAQKDKIDEHYNRRQAEYARRKALWLRNMQGKYHRRNIPMWKYSAEKQGMSNVKLALDMFRSRGS